MSCKTLTPQSVLNGALALLGRPPALIAKSGDLYDIMGTVLENYQNLLNIHDGNFLLKMRRVTLPAQSLEIQFEEPSWGRPVLCDLDPLTLLPGTILPRRDIDLIGIQHMDQYRQTTTPTAGIGSGLTTSGGNQVLGFAQAVAWYREGVTIKLFFEFGGLLPGIDTTYRFFYEPGGVAEVMEDTLIDWVPNFVGILQVDCALAFLPHSMIEEPTYQRLETRLEKMLLKREPVLDQWLRNNHTEQSGRYPGYGRNRVGGYRSVR